MDNRKITIDDIARDLNISKTTVSRAISGKGRIGKETTERVLAYINEKNYRPSAIAKSLAQSKTYNIAFAMPGESKFVDLPFFQKCMWGITSTAATNDYDVLLCIVDESDISGLERLVNNHKVDGVILGRTYENGMAEKYLAGEGIPFVTIGTSVCEGAVQIDNDHVNACRELTAELIRRGMKRLAVIGGRTGHIVNKNRLKGFRMAFEDNNLVPDEDIIITGSSEAENVIAALDVILKKHADCIVCTDDSVCNTVITRLMSLGISIPGEMKVASFYNSSILDNYKPSITSLEFDASEAGVISCKTLLDLVNGGETGTMTLLGYKLRLCESTS